MNAPANKFMPVAKVIKSFGTEGEIVTRFYSMYREEIDVKKPVFIFYDGLPVPFFIRSFTSRGSNQAIIKLGGIESSYLSEEISGETIYADYITGEDDIQEDLSLLVGFRVTDREGNIIGSISSFYDYPGNPCFGVMPANKKPAEFLLPVHEDIILKSDFKRKTIVVSLPKGITEL